MTSDTHPYAREDHGTLANRGSVSCPFKTSASAPILSAEAYVESPD